MFRSRKSWALLAYLVLSDRPPSRAQLAGLLYGEADDPVRALRWGLAEIRRALGADGSVEGDPVVLTLSASTHVDVDVVTRGAWIDAVRLPGLDGELLDGMAVRGAPAFETWLLVEQCRLAAAAEAILHEAALGSLSRGELAAAVGYAGRAAALSPLDENHQALLIRLYRMTGADRAAEQQLRSYTATVRAELGAAPGPAVAAAIREPRRVPDDIADDATVEAIVEAGSAAVSAGATEAGVRSLRTAVRLADRAGSPRLRVASRLVLGEALIHALRGLDEEGLATLFEAEGIAVAHGLRDAAARARAELGYVDFLRGRCDRAELRLTEALAGGSVATEAKAVTYLGTLESDRGNYPRAAELLDRAVALAQAAGEPRREAYALAMAGRVSLFTGALDRAAEQLDASIDQAERDHWLAFLPWPQALRGEVHLARDDPAAAAVLLRQSFARACQVGDPCWEGIAARGLALVADAAGDTDRAFEVLADARARCNRLADPYVWLDGHILDAQCELGRRHGHPDTPRWVDTLRRLASRTGMRGLLLRSLQHGAALGSAADAALLAAGRP